ncbi:DUF4339 domain-containing protein [Mesorhizobium sp. M7A.F.Ca.US.010.02.1.1]|uniref:DUF4339 domain-containing protein n=1 Tax=Mesorhizobium sp. M7A.F.Ca.US.010.02.1.1 TaxID=2496743 RepID=UPI0013E35277|nr:DUF4339 domain-containing protein [Mesorhizobium sp. M7A.F.Ca.US.010.02.1.1]
MTIWFYEENGQPRGPIEETDLTAMFSSKALPANTRIWTDAFGSQWKAASETDIVPKEVRVTPPPLSVVQTAVPATAVVDKWARWIAFSPLVILAADTIVLLAGGHPNIPPISTGVSLWAAIGVFWLAYKDAKAIKNAGQNPTGKALVPFMLLTPVGYLWRRSAVIRAPLRYLWIWLACAAVFLIAELAIDPSLSVANAAETADLLPYGSRAGMTVTITGRSGIDTDHAEITLDPTAANSKGFCIDSNGDDGETCVGKKLADAKIQSSIVANCFTGKFISPWGNGFQFKGRAADGDYSYIVQPDVVPHEVLDYRANYDVAIEAFKALCPARVARADREDPIPEVAEEISPDDAEQAAPNVAEESVTDTTLNGSTFRGIELGMTEAQLTQSLDRSFVLSSKWVGTELQAFAALAEGMNSGIPTGQTLFIVKGPQACGQIVMRDGVAARLRFYQCYFDIGDGMSIGDFAQQIAETYQLEDGMSGHWEMRGDGAYRFKYTEYVGVRQATSERFTASLHQMDNNLTLTIERVPRANFE